VARRPEIPEDVFFDPAPSDKGKRDNERNDAAAQAERSEGGPRSYRTLSPETTSGTPRIGRPPAQEGPKVAVTLYLTEPVAQLLEETRYLLLTEHRVKTSKSAIADFALRHGLSDLSAAADDLRRD